MTNKVISLYLLITKQLKICFYIRETGCNIYYYYYNNYYHHQYNFLMVIIIIMYILLLVFCYRNVLDMLVNTEDQWKGKGTYTNILTMFSFMGQRQDWIHSTFHLYFQPYSRMLTDVDVSCCWICWIFSSYMWLYHSISHDLNCGRFIFYCVFFWLSVSLPFMLCDQNKWQMCLGVLDQCSAVDCLLNTAPTIRLLDDKNTPVTTEPLD